MVMYMVFEPNYHNMSRDECIKLLYAKDDRMRLLECTIRELKDKVRRLEEMNKIYRQTLYVIFKEFGLATTPEIEEFLEQVENEIAVEVDKVFMDKYMKPILKMTLTCAVELCVKRRRAVTYNEVVEYFKIRYPNVAPKIGNLGETIGRALRYLREEGYLISPYRRSGLFFISRKVLEALPSMKLRLQNARLKVVEVLEKTGLAKYLSQS